MAVDILDDLPTAGREALRGVIGHPAADRAVDRDAVVVIDADELSEPERTGERDRFVRDAFHEATVAEEDVGVVVDDVVARAVELRSHQPLGECHADRGGETLAERTGGGLDADVEIVLGVTRRA